MTNAHMRPKQPELVRRTLVECAERIAVEQGLAAVTVQAVARAAGVTKGGLFHHFPSKQALVEALFADLLARLDAEIEAGMEADPVARGRFTRAYVNSVFVGREFGFGTPWAALCMATVAEPSLRRLWTDWLAARLARHSGSDGAPVMEVARLAADGAWLSLMMTGDAGPAPDFSALHRHLLAMTR